jgi:hypothetical protein
MDFIIAAIIIGVMAPLLLFAVPFPTPAIVASGPFEASDAGLGAFLAFGG